MYSTTDLCKLALKIKLLSHVLTIFSVRGISVERLERRDGTSDHSVHTSKICEIHPSRNLSGKKVIGKSLMGAIFRKPAYGFRIPLHWLQTPVCNGSAAINMFMLGLWEYVPQNGVRVGWGGLEWYQLKANLMVSQYLSIESERLFAMVRLEFTLQFLERTFAPILGGLGWG